MCDAMEVGRRVGSVLCVGRRVDYLKGSFTEVDGPMEKDESHGGQMRREETICGNPVLVTVRLPRPPTMVEELWVQETLLSLTVVLVTM